MKLNTPHFSHSSQCDAPSTISFHAIRKSSVTTATLFTKCKVPNTTFKKKNSQISNFMTIRPVGTKLFYADRRTDRQTDMMKLVVDFRPIFRKRLKSCPYILKGRRKLHVLENCRGPQTYFWRRLLFRRLLVAHRCLT